MLNELNARVARMRADLVALEYAFDALALCLPAEQLSAWADSMEKLSAIRAKALIGAGSDANELAASAEAITRRIERIGTTAKLRPQTM